MKMPTNSRPTIRLDGKPMITLPLKNGNRTMNLLTATCIKGVPNLRGQDGKGENAIAYLKFFHSGWTWFLTELDPVTGEAFGKVYSPMEPDGEYGYFSVLELASICRPHAVERDRWFKPTPIKDCDNPCR